MTYSPGELLALPVRFQLLHELERRLKPRSRLTVFIRLVWGMLGPGSVRDRSA
jgi:hypothetical protein